MAPLPATATGVLAIIYRFTVGNDQNVTTKLHFRYTSAAPTTAAMTAFATAVRTDFTTNVKPYLQSQLSLNQVTALDLANPTTPPGVDTTAVPGSRNSGVLPAGTALVAGYPIARRYRGGHPRGYWPLMGASDLADSGHWNGTTLTGVTTAITNHINAVKGLTAGGLALGNQCSVSYYSGGRWVAGTGSGKPKWLPTLRTPPSVDDVIQVRVNNKPGSQRRRLKKA